MHTSKMVATQLKAWQSHSHWFSVETIEVEKVTGQRKTTIIFTILLINYLIKITVLNAVF
jgi:hypothetical protein